MKAIVVRAGLAGLTRAKLLDEPGAEVALLEASDGGGRTDEKDGFLLGRDIQAKMPGNRTATPGLAAEALGS